MGPEILPVRGWREQANPAELPVEVGKVRQPDLLRNDVDRQAGLTQAHAGTSDAKLA